MSPISTFVLNTLTLTQSAFFFFVFFGSVGIFNLVGHDENKWFTSNCFTSMK